MRVYLAGTITADPATHKWREDAIAALKAAGHTPLSPLRKKDVRTFSKDGLTCNIKPELFCARDRRDLRSADVVLVYTLGIETLERQSVGTWEEVGMAVERETPFIIVGTHPTVVNHPFHVTWAAAVVPTLAEALRIIDWLDD